jgi:hypothetical protein
MLLPSALRATALRLKRSLKGLVQRGVGQNTQRGNNPIEKIMLSAAGLAKQPTDHKLDEMAAAAARSLKPLLDIAMSGNVAAIQRVTELASTLTAETTLLACMHQDAANQVARERTVWPLNISNDPAERRRTLRLITGPRKLPLASKTPEARSAPRPGNFAAPANAAVLMALKAIQIERTFRVPSELFPVLQPEWSSAAARLPELDGSGGVADLWFHVIWLYLCHRYGGAPETSTLRKLGEATAPHASETALRAAIRQTLREAFLRMTRKRK